MKVVFITDKKMCVNCSNLHTVTLNRWQKISVVNKEFTLDNLHSSTLNASGKERPATP